MPLRTFMIPVSDTGEASQTLNEFMRQVSVLTTERRVVENGLNS